MTEFQPSLFLLWLKSYMKRYEELEEKIKKSENFDIYRQYYQITHKLLFLL